MSTFIDEIIADIDWRIAELTSIKVIPVKYNFKAEHKNIHIKYCVPAIYAIWEGFVKNSFIVYSNHLNTLSIKREEISISLLTHQLDSACDFNSPRLNFDSKQKMVDILNELLDDIIVIKPNVPTESNVNFKVLNKILDRFCIPNVDSKFEKGLSKLLRFRNMIAHGENSVLVDMNHVTEFISLIENLMLDIVINIDSSEKLKSYNK